MFTEAYIEIRKLLRQVADGELYMIETDAVSIRKLRKWGFEKSIPDHYGHTFQPVSQNASVAETD